MNAKFGSLKAAVFAATLVAGGCSTVPAGYTLVTENDHVVWEAFGQPKLERVPQAPPAQGGLAYKGETAFLQELARSDGSVTGGPVETPSETAVASR